jgi:VanZ family protein
VKSPRTWWLALTVWAGVLWWLSAQPGSGHPQQIPHFDKVLHTGYFFLGGILLQLALRFSQPMPGRKRSWCLGLLVAACVGAVDEFHQTFTPMRSGLDPWDWCADLLGGTLAAYLMLHAFGKRK